MAGGNKGRARRDLMLLPVLSEAEEDQESRGPEEWAQPVPALYEKALGVPWFIILFHCVWGLLGTRLSGDREMDESQQSLQADRITQGASM